MRTAQNPRFQLSLFLLLLEVFVVFRLLVPMRAETLRSSELFTLVEDGRVVGSAAAAVRADP
jgi:hypothetical protein